MTATTKPKNIYAVAPSEAVNSATDKMLAVLGGPNPIQLIFDRARKIQAVREWIQTPEIMEMISPLVDTMSGFMTDKATKSDKYPVNVVSLAVTDALLAGFRITGNEMNIIAGKFYGALNGYRRICSEFESEKYKMVHLDPIEGDIVLNGNMVRVPITIKYVLKSKVDGVEDVKNTVEYIIQLRIKSAEYDTPDGWIGKATRRALKKLWTHLSGVDYQDDFEPLSENAGANAGSSMPPLEKVSLKRDAKPVAPGAEPPQEVEHEVVQEEVAQPVARAPVEPEVQQAPKPAPEPLEPPEDKF